MAFGWLCLVAFVAIAQQTVIVHTDTGLVQGLVEDEVNVFRGIPFAAPPVGDLRWKAPQVHPNWTSVLPCDKNPPMCPQSSDGQTFKGSEDCLYLNVYAPPTSGNELLPVAIWIYGGGFIAGSNWNKGVYDGRNISKTHNYVLVAGNYRLGPLGFLALDGLKSEDSRGSTGNYGTLDQLEVMKWVQRNIRAFGGDPDQVSIFGESAGAMSVCWHLASPLSKGYFKAAIMESGTCDSTNFFVNGAKATSWSQLWAKSVGCPTADLNCLRTLPTAAAVFTPTDLFNVSAGYYLPLIYPDLPWAPVIDGAALTALPYTLFQKGQGNIVPYIGGSNQNEGLIFLSLVPAILPGTSLPMNQSTFEAVLSHFFCANQTMVSQISKQYSVGLLTYPTYDDAAAKMLRDWFFACPTRRTALAFTNVGTLAHVYHFIYDIHWLHIPDVHASELPFVFDNPPADAQSIWDDNDQSMADIFGHYWANLFKSGDPNKPEPVDLQWPNFVSQNIRGQLPFMRLEVPNSVEMDYDKANCDFWDTMLVECANTCGC